MKRVEVHIDRLVLRGFRPEDGHGIAAGMREELARLLSDPRAARQLTAQGDAPRLRIGGVQIGQGAKPRQVGLTLVRGLSKGMKR
jgi:hypothetical protein